MSRGRVVYDTNNLDYDVEDHTGDSDEAFNARVAEFERVDGPTVTIQHAVRLRRYGQSDDQIIGGYDSATQAAWYAQEIAQAHDSPAEAVSREVRCEPWQSEAERAATDALLAPGNETRGPW